MNIPINSDAPNIMLALGMPEGTNSSSINHRIAEFIAAFAMANTREIFPGMSASKINVADIAKTIQEKFTDAEIMFFAVQFFINTMESMPNSTVIREEDMRRRHGDQG